VYIFSGIIVVIVNDILRF